MFQGLGVEKWKIISGAVPVDINGAGLNGDWIHMKNHRKLTIILQQGAWAGGTAAVTLEQAINNAGGSGKALAFSHRYVGVALTNDAYVKTAVTSNTFNLSVVNGVNIIEIDAQDLDFNNDFTHVRVVVASPGANADLLAASYVLHDGTWTGNPDKLPSAID